MIEKCTICGVDLDATQYGRNKCQSIDQDPRVPKCTICCGHYDW